MEAPQLLWAACAIGSVALTIISCFLLFRQELLWFSSCPLPLVLSQGTTWLPPLHSVPSGICIHWRDAPEPALRQARQPQLSQPLLTEEMLQSTNHLCGPVLDLLQYVYIPLVLGSPELNLALLMWPHQQRGWTTSLSLMATCLLTQLRRLCPHILFSSDWNWRSLGSLKQPKGTKIPQTRQIKTVTHCLYDEPCRS